MTLNLWVDLSACPHAESAKGAVALQGFGLRTGRNIDIGVKFWMSLLILGLLNIPPAWGEEMRLPPGLPPEVKGHVEQHLEDLHKQELPRKFTRKDFSFKDLKFLPKWASYIEVSGEAGNLSSSDFRTARFMIKIKGQQRQILAQNDFYLSNFVRGKPTKFNFYVKGFDPKQIKDYEINFEEGFYYDDRE